MAHPLARLLDEAVHGTFPAPDATVEVVGAPPEGSAAIVSFTSHTVIALDADPAEVARRVAGDPLATPASPAFLQWIADHTGTRHSLLDAVFATFAVGGEPSGDVEPVAGMQHPRIERAARNRVDVRVYSTPERDGVLVLGRGLTRRWEAAFEVDEAARGRGIGRRLASAARALLPAGTPLWMQVAPANARSVRAVLGAGYRPIGAEILFKRP